MSSTLLVTAEEVSSLLATVNCANAAFVMLIYDWLLCLDQEVALVWNWKTRRTIAPPVYVLVRYIPIVQNSFAVATILPISLLSCDVAIRAQFVSAILSFVGSAAFSTVRIYALSGKSICLAVATFILSTVPIITNLLRDLRFQSIHVLPNPINCSLIDQTPQQLGYDLTMIARVCALSADLLVVVITWMYTYKSYKIQKNLWFGPSLGNVMLYDGSLYFVVLASLNVLQMVLARLQINSLVSNTGSYVSIFLDPFSDILICHFLLNLHQVDHNTADSSLRSDREGDLSIQFAAQSTAGALPAFVGSFGEPVHTGSALDPDLDFEGDLPDLMQNMSSEPDGEIVEADRA